jgi:hypothetical protein
MQRAKEQLLRQQLKASLKALPAPKNDYEINFAAAIPEQKGEEEEGEHMEEDAQDQKRRLERERAAAEEAERKRR